MSSLRKNISALFKFADVFGASINFLINKSSLYKTACSGVWSIMFIGFATYYCMQNFILFADRSKISILYNEKVISPNPKIDFNLTKFNVAFTFKYDNNSALHPGLWKYFNEQAYLCTYYNSTKKVKVPLKLRYCTSKDFYNLYNDERLALIGIPNLKCAENASNITLQGAFSDEIYRYIEYGIYLNDYLFLPNATAEMNEVVNLFAKSQFKLAYTFIDGAVDVNNQSFPQNNFLTSYFFQMDINLVQKVDIDFAIQTFKSDENILFESFGPEGTRVQYDDAFMHFSTVANRTQASPDYRNIIGKIYIRSSSKLIVYERQYQKLTDYLANMTGLLGQILFIIYLGCHSFNSFEGNKKVMNHVLKYNDHLRFSGNLDFEDLKKKVLESKIIMEKQNSKDEGDVFGIDSVDIPKDNEITENYIPTDRVFTKRTNQSFKVKSKRTIIDNRLKLFPQIEKNLTFNIPPHKDTDQDIENEMENEEEKEKGKVNEKKEKEDIGEDNSDVKQKRDRFFSHVPKISILNMKKITEDREAKELATYNLNKNNNNKGRLKLNNFVDTGNRRKSSIFTLEDIKPIVSDTKLSKPITINFFEKILSYLCCRVKGLKLKKRIYDRSEMKYHYYLDIHTYIKKMQEIDILKYLFLNNHQLILFNFIAKPSVSLSSNRNDALLHKEIEDTNYVGYHLKANEIGELIKAYDSLTDESEDGHEINQKIVTLFNNEILNLMS